MEVINIIIHLQALMKMYGFEINQLSNLLKECDPNRNDSDSDDEQVAAYKYLFLLISFVFLAKEKFDCSFNSCESCFASTKNCSTY